MPDSHGGKLSGTSMQTQTGDAALASGIITWDLQWNNPKIHTPDRRKSWLACDEHRASLSDFLGARGFLKDVVPHAPAD